MSVDAPRAGRRPARVAAARAASPCAMLERVLPRLEGGTLDVRLPGRRRDGGSARGPAVRMAIARRRGFFRRIATRGEARARRVLRRRVSGDADDLPGCSSSCSRNAEPGASGTRACAACSRLRPRLNRRNGLARARAATSRYHYDLGNELFELDARRDDDLLLRRLRARGRAARGRPSSASCGGSARSSSSGAGDHVLEIGCGWGSFALVAAGEYGARVTGLTISREQADARAARVAEAGLADRVEIREQDYRERRRARSRRSPRSRCSRRSARSSSPTYFADHRPGARARRHAPACRRS